MSVEQKAPSKSGKLAVGISMYDYALTPSKHFFPVVMVDSRVPDIYDVRFFDLSTLYAGLLNDFLELKFPMPFPADLEASVSTGASRSVMSKRLADELGRSSVPTM